MRYIFMFLFIGLTTNIFAQSITYTADDTDYKNDGNRDQIIRLKKDGTPLNGIIQFGEFGQLNCENGKIILEIFYYKNGNMKSRCEFKDGKQHGKQEFFFKNGNKSEVFSIDSRNPAYKNGKESWNQKQHIVGQHLIYYKNGTLSHEENSNEKGEYNGVVRGFYKSGVLRYEGNYVNGRLQNGKYFNKKGIEIKSKS